MSKRGKLSLSRETVRELADTEGLEDAAGGFVTLTCLAICGQLSRAIFPCPFNTLGNVCSRDVC